MKTAATQLKARLGRYLHAVRNGQELIITDRKQPIARLVPYAPTSSQENLLVSRPRDPTAPSLGKVVVCPIRYRGTDSTALLQQERQIR